MSETDGLATAQSDLVTGSVQLLVEGEPRATNQIFTGEQWAVRILWRDSRVEARQGNGSWKIDVFIVSADLYADSLASIEATVSEIPDPPPVNYAVDIPIEYLGSGYFKYYVTLEYYSHEEKLLDSWELEEDNPILQLDVSRGSPQVEGRVQFFPRVSARKPSNIIDSPEVLTAHVEWEVKGIEPSHLSGIWTIDLVFEGIGELACAMGLGPENMPVQSDAIQTIDLEIPPDFLMPGIYQSIVSLRNIDSNGNPGPVMAFFKGPTLNYHWDENLPAISPGEVGAELSAEGAVPPPRYANTVLLRETGDEILKQDASLSPNSVVRLRLDIGDLARESAVISPEPLPDHLLPQDIWLDVLVYSTDFTVSRSRDGLGSAQTAQGRFFLPGNGSAAHTPENETFLYFFLQTPQEAQSAQVVINYYYCNHLVQSQLLTASVGEAKSGYRVEIIYTLSKSLVGISDLLLRTQVSIMASQGEEGRYTITMRAGNEQGNLDAEPVIFALDKDKVHPIVKELRETLSGRVAAAKTRQRTKQELIEDLRTLAPLGRQLWNPVVAPIYRSIQQLLCKTPPPVIQVSRPTGSSYTFPWGLVYSIPIATRIEARNLKICRLVEEWDEHSPLIEPGQHVCPKAPHPNGVHDENTLCPFGFWSYHYLIEQLSSRDRPDIHLFLPAKSPFQVVVAETQYQVNLKALESHIAAIQKILKERFPHAVLSVGNDLQRIKELLGNDVPLIYFYCHGERDDDHPANTYLGVGNREAIPAEDFQSWVQSWYEIDHRTVWDSIRPLIFINACHSAEINPDTLVSYLDAFVTTGNAAGMIGTEVSVRQPIAMDFALEFFKHFFDSRPVGEALHKARTAYLADGNLYGLIYTPYCPVDLDLTVV